MKALVISGDRSGTAEDIITLALASLLSNKRRSRPSRWGWTTSTPPTYQP